ncbi:putative Oxidoreductase, alcohol dehydrogenase-like protein [Nitrospira sp. KM1]|uniref:bi-domain-containing oxidoreductase n=1 Tax=Nitrospira sp. KM1 TaxID=1936990 RepID=UPI0013A7321E|nr:bi-domain-containing oxidoreductase [Nitrospira sp. KM1]BCA53554.1 putative Oxidoreductase, alcohol dehydrogenase-like protein [Nitrospira sp. KM1]
MKQILQHLGSGETHLSEIPSPKVRENHLLIETTRSLVSSGTERMLVEFGKANWIDKARQQPEKVRMVLDKVKADGLMPTIDAVRHKLDQPLPMGYCNVGRILEVGDGVAGFAIGDRVASNGKHAEIVCVPRNLCAKIPDLVGDEEAAFTVVGAIALQGIRLLQPTLGEAVVVTGLGLIGLMTVQLLKAHGCRVLGLDYDPAKLTLAEIFGADVLNLAQNPDPLDAAMAFSRGRGVDAVIITASTKSNEPVHQAALMCRKRGRIVLVGVTGLELSRADFYEKELSFQVSCSYGPGRYDPQYEECGQDYPFGLVRWTEQRNFEAVLDMLADRRLDVGPLISHRIPFDTALAAYDLISSGTPSLGIILQYPASKESSTKRLSIRTVTLSQEPHSITASDPVVGCIGAGNYATQVLLPAFKSAGAGLHSVASSTGVSAAHAGRKFGFAEATSDGRSVIDSVLTNTIVIATRHDSHARLVCDSLKAGKHVFVEKPLAITREDLDAIIQLYQSVCADKKNSSPLLMVGFNRRFSPQIVEMKRLLVSIEQPKTFIMTVNAGHIPPEHWTQDRQIGGGRIIGEGCHFVDLLRFLVGSPVTTVQALMMGSSNHAIVRDDKVVISMKFENGSTGTIHYLANGHKSFPKERLEVFSTGRVLQLDNFRRLTGFGWPGFRKMNLWRQDKGNAACVAAFVDAIRQGGPSPIPFHELVEVTRTTFDIMDSLA